MFFIWSVSFTSHFFLVVPMPNLGAACVLEDVVEQLLVQCTLVLEGRVLVSYVGDLSRSEGHIEHLLDGIFGTMGLDGRQRLVDHPADVSQIGPHGVVGLHVHREGLQGASESPIPENLNGIFVGVAAKPLFEKELLDC